MKIFTIALFFLLHSSLLAQKITAKCIGIGVGLNIKVEIPCGKNGLSKEDADLLAKQYADVIQKLDKQNGSLDLALKRLASLRKELESYKPGNAVHCENAASCQIGDNNQSTNIINQLGKTTAPTRHLSQQQVEELKRLGETLPPNTIQKIRCSNSAEPCQLAKEISDAVKNNHGTPPDVEINLDVTTDTSSDRVAILLSPEDVSALKNKTGFAPPNIVKLIEIFAETMKISIDAVDSISSGHMVMYIPKQEDIYPTAVKSFSR